MGMSRPEQMALIKGRHTTPERRLSSPLGKRAEISATCDARTPAGRPDIVFHSARVAIFIDGCVWHGCLLRLQLKLNKPVPRLDEGRSELTKPPCSLPTLGPGEHFRPPDQGPEPAAVISAGGPPRAAAGGPASQTPAKTGALTTKPRSARTGASVK